MNDLTNSNATSNVSVITTFVALLKPLFVTVIVKFTRSPTLALAEFAVFTMVKLTFGVTVMLVSFDGTSVVFSQQ